MNKLPKEIKDAVDRSPHGEIMIDAPVEGDLQNLEWFDQKMIHIRDEIAKVSGSTPEDVRLIGIRVFYIVGREKAENGEYVAVASRCKYDPNYIDLLERI